MRITIKGVANQTENAYNSIRIKQPVKSSVRYEVPAAKAAGIISERMVKNMKKYVCGPCGYEYDPAVGDPDNGIAAGTAFEDLPEDWVCPICGVGKDDFEEA